MTDLRYPIGRFVRDPEVTPAKVAAWTEALEAVPGEYREAVAGLEPAQLDTPYRPDGWTVRQVVHHVPDSHLNLYVRFKLALTEQQPTIRPWDPPAWADLPDCWQSPVEASLTLLEGVHRRWLALLALLGPADLARRLVHPESGIQTAADQLQLCAWHGRHHVAHITALRRRMGWGSAPSRAPEQP
jgi:hypothetical protein